MQKTSTGAVVLPKVSHQRKKF